MKYKTISLHSILLSVLVSLAASTSYADSVIPMSMGPTPSGFMAAVNAILNAIQENYTTIKLAISENQQAISSTVKGNQKSITQTLNNLLLGENDPFFLTVSDTSSSNLDPSQAVNQMNEESTGAFMKQEMSSTALQLGYGYRALTYGTQMPITVTAKNPLENLTQGKPSWDSLFLPTSFCTNPLYCKQPEDDTASSNAKDWSFNAFLDPASYQNPSSQPEAGALSPYTVYVLQTYQPLITPESGTATFFHDFNLAIAKHKTNSTWVTNEMTDLKSRPLFQQYQADSRSYWAKKSLLVSNFEFLAAERKPIKNLGKTYGLPKNDASSIEVEQAILHKTVDNPKWYKAMQNASTNQIAKEQLQLTAANLKLSVERKAIEERLLAVESIKVAQSLETPSIPDKLTDEMFPGGTQPTESANDASAINHTWSNMPSSLQKKVKSQAKKVKNKDPGSYNKAPSNMRKKVSQ